MKIRLLLLASLAACMPLAGRAEVSVSILIAPPPLPVYVQPVIPAPGYIWTPGYWRWNPIEGDYYWVPGTWILPPAIGLLWTPGYWDWDGGYGWHAGYWAPRVGFYGGINYGCGYTGNGYQGGFWRGTTFNYNRSVNNINTTIVHSVYNTTVVQRNVRVSYSGGPGGIVARPSVQDRQAAAFSHVAPTRVQRQHEQIALAAPDQRASINHGMPRLTATARPEISPRPTTWHSPAPHAEPRREEGVGNPVPPRPQFARVDSANVRGHQEPGRSNPGSMISARDPRVAGYPVAQFRPSVRAQVPPPAAQAPRPEATRSQPIYREPPRSEQMHGPQRQAEAPHEAHGGRESEKPR